MNAPIENTTVAHIILDNIAIPVDVKESVKPKSSKEVIELVVTHIVNGFPVQVFDTDGKLVSDINYVIGKDEKIQYTNDEDNQKYTISAEEFRNAINYNRFVEFVCDPAGNAILEPVMIIINGLDMLEYYTRSNHRRKLKGDVLVPVFGDILSCGDIKTPRGSSLDVKVSKSGNSIVLRLGIRSTKKQYTAKKAAVLLDNMKDLFERYDFSNYLNSGNIETCEIKDMMHSYIRYEWKVKISNN